MNAPKEPTERGLRQLLHFLTDYEVNVEEIFGVIDSFEGGAWQIDLDNRLRINLKYFSAATSDFYDLYVMGNEHEPDTEHLVNAFKYMVIPMLVRTWWWIPEKIKNTSPNTVSALDMYLSIKLER